MTYLRVKQLLTENWVDVSLITQVDECPAQKDEAVVTEKEPKVNHAAQFISTNYSQSLIGFFFKIQYEWHVVHWNFVHSS